MSNTIKVSNLYDKIVDEFNIPAQALSEEAVAVRKHLSALSQEQLEKIELHVRRLHDQNQKKRQDDPSSLPIIEVITLHPHPDPLSFDFGSSICLPIHFVNLNDF